MHAVGIIAEYNPFHNGHAYHLSCAKRLSGCTHAIVAMSGSFVQRGDTAAFDKFARARWALCHGADLVLELPTAFACASAERFARGGVALLAGTGLVSALAFGAEHADLALLSAMAFSSAGETDSDASERRIAFYLKQGLSFPAARARAYAEIAPDAGNTEAFASPNNILAVEYLRALASIAPGISSIAVPRTGAAHDAPCASAKTGFASASALREAAERCDMLLLRSAAPAQVAAEIEAAVMALHAPKSAAHLSDAILYALRREARTALASLPDVSEGLENVLYEKARSCTGLSRLPCRRQNEALHACAPPAHRHACASRRGQSVCCPPSRAALPARARRAAGCACAALRAFRTRFAPGRHRLSGLCRAGRHGKRAVCSRPFCGRAPFHGRPRAGGRKQRIFTPAADRLN